MKNQAYTEAFHDGMRAACVAVTHEVANAHARAKSVQEGDAYLAGYYAELRAQSQMNTYRILAFDVVDAERKLRVEAKVEGPVSAELLFDYLGPRYDVVQLWSIEDGQPVYRQF